VSVLTERELRREQRRPGPILVARGGSTGPATHCPDLAVQVAGRRWAVEIEFSAKGRERLRRILAAYGGSDYTGVVYYLREPALARAISRLALDCGLNGELALRAWELWPAPSQDAAEIERVARRHREAALERGNGAPPTCRTPRKDADIDRRQRERAAAIEGWERELERRDAEGVEAHAHQAAQPDRARHPGAEGPRVGRLAQGLLAHLGLRSASARPAQRLLARPGPQGIQRSLPPFRDATRTAGCGPARPVVWEGPG
jgi:hypothetical protein